MIDGSPAFVVLVSGGAIVAAWMASLWAVHLAIRNAAIVDAGWAAGLPMLALWYAWQFHAGARGWLLTAMVVVWGLRLAGYLFVTRVVGQEEEGRYRELRARWKTHLAAKFFVFFEAQAVLAVVLSAPMFLAARHAGAPGVVEWAAAAIGLAAIVGEAAADRELARFKRDVANRGRVCDIGLWRYSRHPNYFFEWLIWIAYALYASASPWGWIGWLSPALIFYFLWRVTGIPATEAQALRSRPDAYRRYQQTTSAFVPWFPRRPSA